MVAAYFNALLWGVGNGLASMTLIIYWARHLDADGQTVSWLLAAPSLVGLLRLATPLLVARLGSRKRFCIRYFLAAAVVLAVLPVLASPEWLTSVPHTLAGITLVWVTYHLLEFMAAVAFWSWLGDLAPRRIRGAFLGKRQAFMNVGKIVGTLAALATTLLWQRHCKKYEILEQQWKAYAACCFAGVMAYLLAVYPLFRMQDLPEWQVGSDGTRKSKLPKTVSQLLTSVVQPLADARFRKLLRFGVWFSLSNGIIQTAQSIFHTNYFSFAEKKTLDSVSRGAQASLLPWAGRLVDRRGNVPVLVFSQALIACAPLFFLLAISFGRWWVLGAYVCWLAYAGENITQPNLMLGLSPKGKSTAYASAWFAWTHLAFSMSILAGGWLFDRLKDDFHVSEWLESALLRDHLDHFALLFLLSWVLKSIAVVLAKKVPEP